VQLRRQPSRCCASTCRRSPWSCPKPSPKEPLAAADALQAQLSAAQQLQAKHVSCCQQQLVSANECTAKEQELQQARDALAPIQAQAGAKAADLLQLAERSEECQRLLQRQKDLQATLHSAGDGLPTQDLQAELGERSLDTVQAELLQAQSTHKQHTEDLQAAREALKQQRQTFDAHAASTALQTATADKEAAITDIHAAAADYVAYALATDLLEQAMEKLRAEQQDPLIVHAGQLFAACTKGAFVGMQAGLGDRGEPKVFGIRRTGEQVCLSQMSDGSRDQLFLSFRLASIYSYCRAAEPLPFVADDLLVHFDEERSAATLGMLAELGQVTQVMLFTHHQHVLELAQPLIERQAAAVVRLD
jgi:uncharacterized protein YhaN